MRKGTAVTALVALGLLYCGRGAVDADGPHWQIPNPRNEYEMQQAGKKVLALPAADGGALGAKGRGIASSPMVNPGDFFAMDDKTIAYYEQHCAIKYGNDKQKFYLLIMERAAQAMRELDTYLPCPDSYPLWHSEEGREHMEEFAIDTWVMAAQLAEPLASACCDFAVLAYIETLRFRDPGDRPAVVTQFLELNNKLRDMCVAAAGGAQAGSFGEWRKLAKSPEAVRLMRAVREAFSTFGMMTGDIPAAVSDAQARMDFAMMRMGRPMLAALQRGLGKTNNPNIQKALRSLIERLNDALAPRRTGSGTSTGSKTAPPKKDDKPLVVPGL